MPVVRLNRDLDNIDTKSTKQLVFPITLRGGLDPLGPADIVADFAVDDLAIRDLSGAVGEDPPQMHFDKVEVQPEDVNIRKEKQVHPRFDRHTLVHAGDKAPVGKAAISGSRRYVLAGALQCAGIVIVAEHNRVRIDDIAVDVPEGPVLKSMVAECAIPSLRNHSLVVEGIDPWLEYAL